MATINSPFYGAQMAKQIAATPEGRQMLQQYILTGQSPIPNLGMAEAYAAWKAAESMSTPAQQMPQAGLAQEEAGETPSFMSGGIVRLAGGGPVPSEQEAARARYRASVLNPKLDPSLYKRGPTLSQQIRSPAEGVPSEPLWPKLRDWFMDYVNMNEKPAASLLPQEAGAQEAFRASEIRSRNANEQPAAAAAAEPAPEDLPASFSAQHGEAGFSPTETRSMTEIMDELQKYLPDRFGPISAKYDEREQAIRNAAKDNISRGLIVGGLSALANADKSQYATPVLGAAGLAGFKAYSDREDTQQKELNAMLKQRGDLANAQAMRDSANAGVGAHVFGAEEAGAARRDAARLSAQERAEALRQQGHERAYNYIRQAAADGFESLKANIDLTKISTPEELRTFLLNLKEIAWEQALNQYQQFAGGTGVAGLRGGQGASGQRQGPGGAPRAGKSAASGIAALSGDPQEFATLVEPVLASELQAAGLNPALAPAMAAQLALESGYGKSAPGNMLAGIKADKAWTGPTQTLMTNEFVNGQMQRVPQTFRKYSSHGESARDYVAFLQNNPRYARALRARTPDEYFPAIQKAGYATDPAYANKLQSAFRAMYGS